ncbi:hypothetical protein VT99_12683 [Candidatus Electrothrix marina]|jgi:hypothetical protein|uniref:PilZ domain-containing protein n=1 Tax=Candidatus Electrothrix marina TaxID=1859130 RepID=A0A444IXH8_9BACT|nr:hypothetical protein VT99_12683 [Candidatus Electrothrix marina]
MIERRRFNRVSCNARVSLTLCDSYKIKNRNDSPVTGEMIDFSLHGACLLPDKIQYGCRHIFNSTQHHNDYIIRLEYISDDENNSLVTYGNSAWYNQSSFDNADRIRFKLGIEFLEDQDQDILRNFYAKLANRQNAEKGWLKKLFRY